MMNGFDEDSESDSDYVPEGSDVEENAVKRRKGDSGEIIGMNSYRRRKAVSVWEELQSQDQEYIKMIMARAVDNSLTVLERPSSRMRRRAKNFMENMIKIYGNNQTLKSVRSMDTNIPSTVRSKALEAVVGLTRKTKVEEKRKFAGQEITVLSTVSKVSGLGEDVKTTTNGTLDQALNLLKGPKAINTVSKSSMDWENYKEKEGLQDDLAQSKENYLERKEFLDRCDYRSFEQERDERLAKQAQRGSA